ncbi:MAG: RsmD family RNA methyltransferase [Alphaproteobacteria bacterium]|nr:RsmD family RNA methyltransferase [Alphaproteobacteria bacterium]
MKIISGKLKGRRVTTKENSSYRPMTGKIKEAVFSILSSGKFLDADNKSALQDAVSIDVFGGTGAISFEGFSRGIRKGIIVEKNLDSFNSLKKNIQTLGLAGQLDVIRGDATMLPAARFKCNIAFIDPPFYQNLVEKSVKSLIGRNWLHDNALLVIRTHFTDEFDISDVAEEIFSRKYNNSVLAIHRIKSL